MEKSPDTHFVITPTDFFFAPLIVKTFKNERNFNCMVLGKGKAVPLQAWSGPEGFRKLRFPDFMTTAQDGGKVVSPKHRPPLPPENAPGTYFC